VKDRASALPLLALLGVITAGHLSLFPRVADLDGFYHVGHALAYWEGSPLDTALPWATQSIIGDLGGDLWWGFHVLLIPFAAVGGVVGGTRVAALGLTLTLGLSVWWLLRRHAVPWPALWAALFLVAVPNIFFRHLMLRPHVLSLAASLALLSTLIRGRWWQAAVLSASISWLHLSLFWMGPAIAVAYAMARVPVRAVLEPRGPDHGVPIRAAIPAALAGALAGWLVRPGAPEAARLLNVQLVELFRLKATEAPVTFAAELAPIAVPDLFRTSWLFAVVWVVGLVLWATAAVRALRVDVPPPESAEPDGDARGRERATIVLASAMISVVFLILALTSARRAMEQWVAFGFLLLPFLGATLSPRRWPGPVRIGGAAVLVLYLGWGAWRHTLNVEQVAFRADTLRGAAEYLKTNSEPNDIVFHLRWDNFGPLFAHNRSNRYLGGMDPIFLWAHDSASYWEFFYLSTEATTEWTCGAYPCGAGALDTYDALKDRFAARWVVVEPFRNPRFSLYLLNDQRYELAYEGAHDAVFEIVEDP